MLAFPEMDAPFVAKSCKDFPSFAGGFRFAPPPGLDRIAVEPPSSTVLAHRAPAADQVPCTRLKSSAFSDGLLGDTTTLMVCHVPRKYSQELLACELEAAGFSGRYDFVYLPLKPSCLSGKGFAFVNFTLPEAAAEFYRLFHNSRLRHFSTEKPLEVRPADVQGFDANAEKHCSDPAKHPNSPLFLRPLPAHLARSSSPEQTDQTMKQLERRARRMAKTFHTVCGLGNCMSCGNAVLPSHRFCGGCGCELEANALLSV